MRPTDRRPRDGPTADAPMNIGVLIAVVLIVLDAVHAGVEADGGGHDADARADALEILILLLKVTFLRQLTRRGRGQMSLLCSKVTDGGREVVVENRGRRVRADEEVASCRRWSIKLRRERRGDRRGTEIKWRPISLLCLACFQVRTPARQNHRSRSKIVRPSV